MGTPETKLSLCYKAFPNCDSVVIIERPGPWPWSEEEVSFGWRLTNLIPCSLSWIIGPRGIGWPLAISLDACANQRGRGGLGRGHTRRWDYGVVSPIPSIMRLKASLFAGLALTTESQVVAGEPP